MVYDKLPIALLSALSTEDAGSTNALIAHYLLTHADNLGDLSVRDLASSCHVGVGTVSRFAKDVGFSSFADLRAAFGDYARSYERVGGQSSQERAHELTARLGDALLQVERSVDHDALGRLVDDVCSYEKVSTFGLLKAQTAALSLQVDLLMQGRYVHTSTSLAEQRSHIAQARADELVIIFSYTATYFDAFDLEASLRRLDRPKIWVVSGVRRPMPSFVADLLLFDSDLDQFGHPYQLLQVAALIAQEHAARRCQP